MGGSHHDMDLKTVLKIIQGDKNMLTSKMAPTAQEVRDNIISGKFKNMFVDRRKTYNPLEEIKNDYLKKISMLAKNR
jgi:hypothetical protein